MSKILNISEATSIAFHALGIIAKKNGTLTMAHEIADATGFSKNHLAKILQHLVKNGYLLSTRGPKGGFKASEKTRTASLADIYDLMEGNQLEKICRLDCEKCPFRDCIFGNLEEKFALEFRDYLANKKISEM